MATIRNTISGELGKVEFRLTLKPSKYVDNNFRWVTADLFFDIGKKFPNIEIETDCQDVTDVDYFIKNLLGFLEGNESEFEFFPTEPDYSFKIQRFTRGKFERTESFEVTVSLDLGGIAGGTYGAEGSFELILYPSKEIVESFVVELKQELVELAKGYDKQFGEKPLIS